MQCAQSSIVLKSCLWNFILRVNGHLEGVNSLKREKLKCSLNYLLLTNWQFCNVDPLTVYIVVIDILAPSCDSLNSSEIVHVTENLCSVT